MGRGLSEKSQSESFMAAQKFLRDKDVVGDVSFYKNINSIVEIYKDGQWVNK